MYIYYAPSYGHLQRLLFNQWGRNTSFNLPVPTRHQNDLKRTLTSVREADFFFLLNVHYFYYTDVSCTKCIYRLDKKSGQLPIPTTVHQTENHRKPVYNDKLCRMFNSWT